MAKLKVFRTPIGFHDAYVAAPSQKAALKAWGSDADLFARGVAELVTDPALAAEALARPGEVIRKLRGSAEEQLTALPADKPKPRAAEKAKVKAPRPDRGAVEAAEQALAAAQARHQEEDAMLATEERALVDRRRRLRAEHASEAKKLEAARDAAELAYADALRAWRDG